MTLGHTFARVVEPIADDHERYASEPAHRRVHGTKRVALVPIAPGHVRFLEARAGALPGLLVAGHRHAVRLLDREDLARQGKRDAVDAVDRPRRMRLRIERFGDAYDDPMLIRLEPGLVE